MIYNWEDYYIICLQAKYQLLELKKISSTDNKFKALRDATKRSDIKGRAIKLHIYHSLIPNRHVPPCIPHLGPMLNELSVLSEISQTFLGAEDGTKHINFKKMHQVCVMYQYGDICLMSISPQLTVTVSNVLQYSRELYDFEYNRDVCTKV